MGVYRAKPPTCEGCPALHVGRSYVPASGPVGATKLLLGQGPGEQEAIEAEPFIGPLGARLSSWLAKAGTLRSEWRIDNVVRCWLPGNRAPTKDEVRHCMRAHVLPDLASLPNLRVVVPVGAPATGAILGEAGEETMGALFDVDFAGLPSVESETVVGHRYVVPLVHPGFIVRDGWGLEAAQVVALRRAAGLAATGTPPKDWSADLTKPPPGAVLLPFLKDLYKWRRDLNAMDDRTITVDIETAGHLIVMIGFCRVADLSSICVPFRKYRGELYWSAIEVREAARWVANLLADPTVSKVFHNGQAFDVPRLEAVGFQVRGYVDDTMIMQHVAYPEMPKGLEFCATLYAWARPWKYLSKVTKEGDGK